MLPQDAETLAKRAVVAVMGRRARHKHTKAQRRAGRTLSSTVLLVDSAQPWRERTRTRSAIGPATVARTLVRKRPARSVRTDRRSGYQAVPMAASRLTRVARPGVTRPRTNTFWPATGRIRAARRRTA